MGAISTPERNGWEVETERQFVFEQMSCVIICVDGTHVLNGALTKVWSMMSMSKKYLRMGLIVIVGRRLPESLEIVLLMRINGKAPYLKIDGDYR